MKKKYTFSVMLVLMLTVGTKAQAPYSDAIKLGKLLVGDVWPDNTPTKNEVKDILSHYCSRDSVVEIFLEQNNNPFIYKYANSWVDRSAGLTAGLSAAKSIFSSAGGVNVTNIADGVAKFLIERAKQELSVSFFRDFKETLEKKEYRHLRTLFPNTTSLLRTIDKDIYRFSVYLQALREAFVKDLDNIFDTAPQAVEDGILDAAFNASTPSYLKEIFIYALQITRDLKHGKHPGEIIENFRLIHDATKPGLTDINAVISIIKLFSTSLHTIDPASDSYWASADSLKMLLQNRNAFTIYLGIIYHKAGGINFSNGTEFKTHLARAQNNIAPYLNFVTTCKDRVKDIEDAVQELKGKEKKDISFNEYYNLFNGVINALKLDEDIEDLPGLNITVPQHFKTFIGIAENCNDLYLDISLKKYSSGVMRLVSICDTLLQPAYNNYAAHSTAGVPLSAYKDFRKNLVKYGTFIASIADAKNSDEVKSAIEAAVLPVGSASIKRESCFNISLNAYVGPYAGIEYLPKLKDNKWATTVGVTAPIGVAFSWGGLHIRDTTRKGRPVGGKSITIFVPLVDIGAMASYRLNNDSSAVASEVKLRNIISPGLYLYYGFGRYPISVGLGAQLGPQLREVTAKDINVDKNYYIRFGLNLTVDIPFFNFYTRGN